MEVIRDILTSNTISLSFLESLEEEKKQEQKFFVYDIDNIINEDETLIYL